MVGLDGAGKTTILHKLKTEDVIPTTPTIGFNIETVQCDNVEFAIWDIGGQDKIRAIWQHYYYDVQGLIFVIDSNDKERITQVKEEVDNILSQKELEDVPILIFANKQDLKSCLSDTEIIDKLKLQEVKKRWQVQRSCAVNGFGLPDGLNWLSKNVNESQLEKNK